MITASSASTVISIQLSATMSGRAPRHGLMLVFSTINALAMLSGKCFDRSILK